MSHNTFDIVKEGEVFKCQSHTFPCVGEGKSEAEAIDQMDRKIMYLRDNEPLNYKQIIDSHLKKGWKCGCGEPLGDDKVLSIVN